MIWQTYDSWVQRGIYVGFPYIIFFINTATAKYIVRTIVKLSWKHAIPLKFICCLADEYRCNIGSIWPSHNGILQLYECLIVFVNKKSRQLVQTVTESLLIIAFLSFYTPLQHRLLYPGFHAPNPYTLITL